MDQKELVKRERLHKERDALVVKDNILLRDVRYNLTATEQKIIIYLISKILKDDKDFKHIRMGIRDYCALANIKPGGDTYKSVKESIKTLRDKSWWINYDHGKRLFSWIDTADIENESYIDIVLSESLRPYLLELRENFTKYELINVLVLKSKHSIRLYELFRCNLFLHVWTVSLEELKDILDLTDKYAEYKDLRRYVIDPAVKEISKYTDLSVSYETVKHNRIVTDLIFSIEEKSGYQMTWDLLLNQEERLGE